MPFIPTRTGHFLAGRAKGDLCDPYTKSLHDARPRPARAVAFCENHDSQAGTRTSVLLRAPH